ncbi:MAG: MiaB/RimO family radical SAM methylthiotransferase [Chlorobiaceae bacterium]
MVRTVAAITLGCKLNYAESSAILDGLCRKGWQLSSPEEGADLLIIHTCAVTRLAEKKCRQRIRAIIRSNPRSRIAVIGCYAQLGADALSCIEGVDAILGSNDKFEAINYETIFSDSRPHPFIKVTPSDALDEVFPGYSLSAESGCNRTRAFLKVQDGCDYGCSYCTIPAIRGRSRSLPLETLLDRARQLAASGYREIVLTGVNTGDYSHGGRGLCDLLRGLEGVEVNRIRISSIEPDIVDSELISLIAASAKIVPHLHIPLQSGSDAILGSMRRRYDLSLYRSRIEHAVNSITDCSIGADVMVGYPGETEEDFLGICRFIEELPLAYLHVFSCSVRPGTVLSEQVARRERTPVAPAEIARRSRELSELGRRKEGLFNSRYIGREAMVLFEERSPEEDSQQQSGYTRNYLRVAVDMAGASGEVDLRGEELPVVIERMGDDLILHGRLLSW